MSILGSPRPYDRPARLAEGYQLRSSFKLVVCSHTLRVHDVLKTKASKLRETDSDSNISFLQGKVIEVTLLLWEFQNCESSNRKYELLHVPMLTHCRDRESWSVAVSARFRQLTYLSQRSDAGNIPSCGMVRYFASGDAYMFLLGIAAGR